MDMLLNGSTQIRRGFEEPDWYFRKRSFNIRVRAETVMQFLGGSEPERILDIGCGDGSNSMQLLTSRTRITLVDRSASMLERAQSKVPPELSSNIELMNEDFMTAALEPSSYDLIICLGVIAYVEDVGPFIKRICSLLRPEGSAIVECTDSSHFVSRLGHIVGAIKGMIIRPRFPLVSHTSSEVIGVFGQHGFQTCGAFRYTLPPPGIRFLMSQRTLYRMVRAAHGTAVRSRLSWLGDECIYHFRRAGS